ncbi:MAG: hypothetical protein ACYDGR_15430 [Candidatus Dormibacteria bacterium]
MRRFGVRNDPEEEAIRFYNRVRRGGRWPDGYWERPGRIRSAWAVLDYWLRRVVGSEDPGHYRQLTDVEVQRQGLDKPVAVMEDLYGQHWRDLAAVLDEVRRGVPMDDSPSETAVIDSFNKVYARTFPDQEIEGPHYQSLRRGITRGIRATEAEYAAEEAEREQRFQDFWAERFLTREFRTASSESWTVWSSESGERYADCVLQILEKEAVITLVLRDEEDLLPIIDALERDFPVDKPARYVCWTLKDGFRGVLYYCDECGGLHAEESDDHMPAIPMDDTDD